jgi:hypothetical protein
MDAILTAGVWHAVQWQSTAHVTDETLAITSIFGVDPVEVEEMDDPSPLPLANIRMRLSLERIPDIPSAQIFIPGEPLNAPEFRWTLRTSMSRIEQESPNVLQDGIRHANRLSTNARSCQEI